MICRDLFSLLLIFSYDDYSMNNNELIKLNWFHGTNC